jgi:hypothetical protein
VQDLLRDDFRAQFSSGDTVWRISRTAENHIGSRNRGSNSIGDKIKKMLLLTGVDIGLPRSFFDFLFGK